MFVRFSLLYSLDVSLWTKSIELKEVNKGEHSQSPKNQNDFVLTELRKISFSPIHLVLSNFAPARCIMQVTQDGFVCFSRPIPHQIIVM